MNHRSIITFFLLFVAVGAMAIRLPQLGLRPMHADEAVQAARFRDLWLKGRYLYDPNEFHGPTLMYATLPAVLLGDQETFAETTETMYRLVPVVFGVGLILLFWLLADALGRWGIVGAAIFAAISPATVFYSRYYIHETLLMFFTLAAIACGWRYFRSRKLVWCLLAGACVGLMQATKETAAIAYIAAFIAFGASALYSRWFCSGQQIRRMHPHNNPQLLPQAMDHRPDGNRAQTVSDDKIKKTYALCWWHLVLGWMMAAAVAALFLSSFLKNLRGPLDGILTYLPWLLRAGGASPHVQPWYDYLHRLIWWRVDNGPIWSEGLIVFLAIIGFADSLFESQSRAWARRARRFQQHSAGIGHRMSFFLLGGDPALSHGERRLGDGHAGFIRWVGFYTCAVITVYSAIAYKTPWCLLQCLVGMFILAGVGMTVILCAVRSVPAKSVAMVFLLIMVGQLIWQAYRSSYLFPTDRRNPYVYAQTSLDAVRLAERVHQLAAACDQQWHMPIHVIWKDEYYWPLPWYLRRFKNVGYWTHLPRDPDALVVIASPQYDAALTAQIDKTHIMTEFFELRPQVLAALWVQSDLWETYLRQLGRIQ